MVWPDTEASAYRHVNDNKSSGTRDTKRYSMGTQFLGHIAPNSGPFHLCLRNKHTRIESKNKKTKNKNEKRDQKQNTRKLLPAAYANANTHAHTQHTNTTNMSACSDNFQNGMGQCAIMRDIVMCAMRFRIQLHFIH